jgi:hypothetical protein
MSVRCGWWMSGARWTAQPAFAADPVVSIGEEPKHVLKVRNRRVRYAPLRFLQRGKALLHAVDIVVK